MVTYRDVGGQIGARGFALLEGMVPADVCRRAADWLVRVRNSSGINPAMEPEYENSSQPEGRVVRKLRRLLWADTDFWAAVLAEGGIFELGTQLLGPHAVITHHAAFLKPEHCGSEVSFHQDQALWDIVYPGARSVWIALSDSSVSNGCLCVVPRSHLLGLVEHRRPVGPHRHAWVDLPSSGFGSPESIEMGRGDVLVWHPYLIHGSGPNRSASPRLSTVVVVADGGLKNFRAHDVYAVAPHAQHGRDGE